MLFSLMLTSLISFYPIAVPQLPSTASSITTPATPTSTPADWMSKSDMGMKLAQFSPSPPPISQDYHFNEKGEYETQRLKPQISQEEIQQRRAQEGGFSPLSPLNQIKQEKERQQYAHYLSRAQGQADQSGNIRKLQELLVQAKQGNMPTAGGGVPPAALGIISQLNNLKQKTRQPE